MLGISLWVNTAYFLAPYRRSPHSVDLSSGPHPVEHLTHPVLSDHLQLGEELSQSGGGSCFIGNHDIYYDDGDGEGGDDHQHLKLGRMSSLNQAGALAGGMKTS